MLISGYVHSSEWAHDDQKAIAILQRWAGEQFAALFNVENIPPVIPGKCTPILRTRKDLSTDQVFDWGLDCQLEDDVADFLVPRAPFMKQPRDREQRRRDREQQQRPYHGSSSSTSSSCEPCDRCRDTDHRCDNGGRRDYRDGAATLRTGGQ